jgi:rhamnogalacturonan hydrolase
VANGAQRPPLYLIGNDLFTTQNVTVEGFSVWTESGTAVVNKISNIYGTGDGVYGVNNGLGVVTVGATPTFTSTITVSASPTGWVVPNYPAWAVPTTGYGSMYYLAF